MDFVHKLQSKLRVALLPQLFEENLAGEIFMHNYLKLEPKSCSNDIPEIIAHISGTIAG